MRSFASRSFTESWRAIPTTTLKPSIGARVASTFREMEKRSVLPAATALALRGASSRMAISPNTWPGPSRATSVCSTTMRTSPETTR
jgi:hypothetical protein